IASFLPCDLLQIYPTATIHASTVYVIEYLSTCDLIFNSPVSTIFGPNNAVRNCGVLTLWSILCCSLYRERHSTFTRRDEERGTASRSWHYHLKPSSGSAEQLAHVR